MMSYVTETIWQLGFADVSFRVPERTDDRKYVCVRRLAMLLDSITSRSLEQKPIYQAY